MAIAKAGERENTRSQCDKGINPEEKFRKWANLCVLAETVKHIKRKVSGFFRRTKASCMVLCLANRENDAQFQTSPVQSAHLPPGAYVPLTLPVKFADGAAQRRPRIAPKLRASNPTMSRCLGPCFGFPL